ncbi:MAG: hypothetical protein R6U32_01235 [Candidatus Woesearchaeota archaeon]
MDMEKLLDRSVILFLNTNLRLEGLVVSVSDGFLTLHDRRSGKEHIISFQTLDRIEVKNEQH